jgi:hypothetical protein
LTIGALTVAGAGFWLGGTSSAVGPSPVPTVQAAETQCLTDADGLGTVPAAIVVSPSTPGQFNAYMLNTAGGSYTASTFQVRVMVNQTTPKANGTIWFTYAAYGTATAQFVRHAATVNLDGLSFSLMPSRIPLAARGGTSSPPITEAWTSPDSPAGCSSRSRRTTRSV